MQTEPAVSTTTPQPGHYDIDPSRSRVTFATRHLFGLGRVKGSFAIRRGTADIADPVAASAIYAEIETASFRTKNPACDGSVRSPRFLDPAGHPVMIFRSDRIEAEGQGPVTKERGVEPAGGSRGVAPAGQQGQGPVTKERGVEPAGGSRGVAPAGQQGQGPVTKERGVES